MANQYTERIAEETPPQEFMGLPSKTASQISGTDYMMMVNNSEAYKALVNDVAEAILSKLTSKSFSGLETTAKNVIGALNELNSKSQLNALQSGDLLEFAKSCNRGMTIFRTNNNVINTPAEYCEGYIISADNNVSIMAHDMTSLNIYANQKSNKGDFVGWKKISLE